MVSAFLWTRLLSCLLPFAGAEPASYADFSGGLNTKVSSVLLQDNESPNLQNVLLDETQGITRRKGFSKLNSTALAGGISDVQGVYNLETSGGTKYCVAFSSTTGAYSSDGCATFTSFVSTLTRNNDVNCDAYNDNLYCVNNQYNFRFNGTGQDDVVVPGMPADLNYIRVFRNRCFAAGTDATPSRLFWSNIGDCNTWTTAIDYVDIDAQDGDIITAIGPPFFNFLPVFKKYSTWLVQFDNANSQNRKVINVSKSIGARNQREVAVFNNRLYFSSVGPLGGQPGIYVTDGINIDEASLKLRGQIDRLSTFNSAAGRRTIDTKADWDAGYFNPYAMSSLRDQGIMQSSSTAISESSGFNLTNSATDVSVSTNDVAGSLLLLRSTWSMTNGGFESLDFTNWTLTGSAFQTPTHATTEWQGTACAGIDVSTDTYARTGTGGLTPLTATIEALDGNGNSIKACTLNLNSDCTYNSDTCDVRQSSGTAGSGSTVNQLGLNITNASNYSSIKIKVNEVGYIATSAAQPPAAQVFVSIACTSGGGNQRMGFRSCKTANYLASGSHLSATYDTYITTPTWGQWNVNESSSTAGSATFQAQVSADGSTWDSLVTATPGQIPVIAQKRYFRYKASLANTSAGNTPQISVSSITAVSTGSWKSPELLLSNTMANTWGLFQTYQTTTGLGSIAYDIRISTYSGGTPFAKAVSVTPGMAISWSTGAYVAINSTFTVTAATDVAKVDAIVINWSEGTPSRTGSMAVFKNRLHYSAQSSSGTYNDVIYVFDTKNAWTKFAGVNARFMNTVSNNFVFGGSVETSAGYVYKLYDTDSDDGSAINAFWDSKDHSFGKLQNIKAVDRIYVVHKNDATTLSTSLLADTGLRSVSYDLNLSTGAAFGIKNKTVDTPLNGNTFRIRFANNAASKPWEVQGYGFLWRDVGLMPASP